MRKMVVMTSVVVILAASLVAGAARSFSDRLIPRSDWTLHPQLVPPQLEIKPARYVLVGHTAGKFCNDPATCKTVIQAVEDWNIQTGSDMIGYNFLISGNGKIYEGRGWNKEGAVTHLFNCATLSVGFMGHFNKDNLNEDMVAAYSDLIMEGVESGQLKDTYKMFAHSQVMATESPGIHIRQVVNTWPHWSEYTKADDICKQ